MTVFLASPSQVGYGESRSDRLEFGPVVESASAALPIPLRHRQTTRPLDWLFPLGATEDSDAVVTTARSS